MILSSINRRKGSSSSIRERITANNCFVDTFVMSKCISFECNFITARLTNADLFGLDRRMSIELFSMLYVFNDFILDTYYNSPHSGNQQGILVQYLDEILHFFARLCWSCKKIGLHNGYILRTLNNPRRLLFI